MDAPLLPALPGYDNPQLIAHGTTALVFRAIQTNLNRLVAIKVITVDTGSVPVNAARELAMTVALSSQPHIVSIIDTGVTEDDRPYIVMEYCEGGSYAQILRHGGPLPVDDVVEVGTKIGEALHAAHRAGIVHRDVKPSNILRSRFGPALTDFGIARAPDELGGTLTREMMTPHHASPEALLHQAQSGISDVYSLASTLWTLLVGHPPFVEPAKPALDIYAFRDRVLHDPLPTMSRDEAPTWLVSELARAMSKLPSQRHGSALEFADALRRGALGLPPGIAPPTAAVAPLSRGRVHTPGVPAQAWPTAQAPAIGGPPAAPPLDMDAPPLPKPAADMADADVADADVADADVADADVADADVADEGGWLGPASQEAWRFEPDVTVAQAHPTQRFDERDLMPPGPGRRGVLVAALVAVAVLAVAGASLLLLNARGSGAPGRQPTVAAPAAASPSTTRFITARTQGAPTGVRIVEDRGTSVTITWADPTGATVSFLVVGTGPAAEKLETRSVPKGTLTITYTDLSSTKNYCFVVGAVYAVDDVATATDVCTKR